MGNNKPGGRIIAQLNKVVGVGDGHLARKRAGRSVHYPPLRICQQKAKGVRQALIKIFTVCFKTFPGDIAAQCLLLRFINCAQQGKIDFLKTPGKNIINGSGNTFKRVGGFVEFLLPAAYKGKNDNAQNKQIDCGNDP